MAIFSAAWRQESAGGLRIRCTASSRVLVRTWHLLTSSKRQRYVVAQPYNRLDAMPAPSASPAQVQLTMPSAHKDAVRSAAQLDIVYRDRQLSFSDVVRGTFGAHPVKMFLYAWSVIVILIGLSLLGLGMYLLYFQDNAHIAPAFVYYVASYTGLALALLSGLGLYGLQQQRKCVTHGTRNYSLGTVRVGICQLVAYCLA